MKRNRIFSALLASALALGSSATFALPPTVTPDVEMFLSGSSATDNMLKGLFESMCQTSTLDVYLDNSATPGSSHRAFFCTVGSPTFATPLNVLVHKTSVGGSTNAVVPVADGTALNQMVINNAGVNGSARTTPCATTATPNVWSCSFSGAGETIAVASDGGISDVEPAMFRGVNVEVQPGGVAGTDVTQAQISNLNVNPLNAVVFGITVTKSLRDRLQFVQNLTPGAEDALNMPTLTSAQVAAVFVSGGVVNWSSFRVPANHPNAAIRGLAINDPAVAAAAGTVNPTNTAINICRRAQGSGTQAQLNANFLRVPCTAGALAPRSGAFDPATPLANCPGTGAVSMCSSTGNLTTCMNNKEAANVWAFGLHSTENVPKSTDLYRFIKIHGVTPDIKNAADGQYDDWAETTMQWRNGPGLVTSAPVPSPNVLAILTKIKNDGATGALIAAENTKFVHSWGQGGFLAKPSATNVAAANGIFSVSNPVNTGSRDGNSCRIPRITRATPASRGDHLP